MKYLIVVGAVAALAPFLFLILLGVAIAAPLPMAIYFYHKRKVVIQKRKYLQWWK
jgi:hypothetical protein